MQKIFEIITYVHAQIDPVTQLVPTASFTLISLILRIIDWILFLGGGIAVIFVMYGGILMIMSAGDEEKFSQGKKSVINAVIGVIVITLSFVIVSWVNTIINQSA